MAQYAKDTEVTADRSRNEIESVLKRYGATKFMYGWDETQAVVMFDLKERRLKFLLPLPMRKDFLRTETGRARTSDLQITQAHEQGIRQRWRALLLSIKAKLESVESGIETFDEAFMPQIVMPSGQTVGEWLPPQLVLAYQNNVMPPLLPGGG